MNIKKWRLPLIFSIALLVRLVYLYQIDSIPFTDVLILDALFEDRMGQEISKGNWGSIGSVYALFLGSVYAVSGHHLWLVRVIQAIMDSGTCIILYFIASMVFNPTVGIITSILSSLYGPFIYYQGFIQKTTVSSFLFSLFIMFTISAIKTPDKKRWFFSGITLWIVAMTRPNTLIFAPFIIIWYLLFFKPPPFPIKRGIFIFNFMLGIVLVPLLLNVFVYSFKNPSGLSLSSLGYGSGLNFYIGNNPKAVGVHTPITVRTIPEKEWVDAVRIANMESGRTLTPSEVSEFWFNKGLDFVREEPGGYLRLLGKKILLFWNYYEAPDVYNYYFFRGAAPVLNLFLTFGIIAPLGITGMIISFKEYRNGRILTGFILIYMISLIVLYITSRYRIPAVLMLFPFSAYTLAVLSDHLREKAYNKLLPIAISIILIGVVTNLPILDGKKFLSQTHSSIGNIYHGEKKLDMAISEYQTAINIDPYNWTAANNLAYLYAEQGENLYNALSLVQMAIQRDHASPEFLDTLSYIYLKMGRTDEARETILKAVSLYPGDSQLMERQQEMDNKAK